MYITIKLTHSTRLSLIRCRPRCRFLMSMFWRFRIARVWNFKNFLKKSKIARIFGSHNESVGQLLYRAKINSQSNLSSGSHRHKWVHEEAITSYEWLNANPVIGFGCWPFSLPSSTPVWLISVILCSIFQWNYCLDSTKE